VSVVLIQHGWVTLSWLWRSIRWRDVHESCLKSQSFMYGRTGLLNSSIDLHFCTFLRRRHSCCKIAIGTSLCFPFSHRRTKGAKLS